MERQRIGIVVDLHIPIVFGGNFADAFQSEPMIMAAGRPDSRTAVFAGKRIGPTGVYDGQNGKRRFLFFACADFNKCVRNVFGRRR